MIISKQWTVRGTVAHWHTPTPALQLVILGQSCKKVNRRADKKMVDRKLSEGIRTYVGLVSHACSEIV